MTKFMCTKSTFHTGYILIITKFKSEKFFKTFSKELIRDVSNQSGCVQKYNLKNLICRRKNVQSISKVSEKKKDDHMTKFMCTKSTFHTGYILIITKFKGEKFFKNFFQGIDSWCLKPVWMCPKIQFEELHVPEKKCAIDFESAGKEKRRPHDQIHLYKINVPHGVYFDYY